MRQVCGRNPKGVLYHEIYEPLAVAEELAEAAGLITSPHNLINVILSYMSTSYQQYHILPGNPIKGVSDVLKEVAKQAEQFKKKYGFEPVFVIDGVDLVAKTDP